MSTRKTLLLAAATVLVACSGGSNSDTTAPSKDAPVYLALGDSVPFGITDALAAITQDPRRFEGYPKFLADMVDLPLLNAACPGEASGSFNSVEAPDNGCRAYRAFSTLHVEYQGTQLAYALDVVATYPQTVLVTLQIGANDILMLLNSCMGDEDCIASGLPDVLQEASVNVGDIVSALRSAGYTGQLVVLGYYSPNSDLTPPIEALNEVLEQAAAGGFDADFVDLYGPFGSDPCGDGLIAKVSGQCEIHPSRAGHQLIASQIAKIVQVTR